MPAQYDAQCDVQSEVFVFDEEASADYRNPFNDVPIPFMVVRDVERGAALEDVDPRGMVP